MRRAATRSDNACLSFGYSMLTRMRRRFCGQQLEPSIGAFHVSRPGRPALALDLMEPFRPLIADSVAITAFNRGELTTGHFLRTAEGCIMTDHGRRAFFNAYGRRMDVEVTHPVFEYKLSYRRMIVLHARMIAAWLLEEAPTLAFLPRDKHKRALTP
jgi:CRISPR-associated protein Cas1